MILLRVSEVLSSDGFSVNIIPEFPISKTEFPGSRSFGRVVDFVMTKLPERYTREFPHPRNNHLAVHYTRLLTWGPYNCTC